MKCTYCNQDIVNGYRKITYEEKVFCCCSIECEEELKEMIIDNRLKAYNDRLLELKDYYSNTIDRSRRKGNKKNMITKKKLNKSKKYKKHKTDKYYYITSEYIKLHE